VTLTFIDLALATGRVDKAIGHYTTAIEMNARIGARPFLALSRLGLAKALVARGVAGDLPAARALVTEAAAEFRRLDLPGPLAAADALLTRIDAAANAANPLSRRESEVASLIALAMSNRQIAEQLVLSERTVETHVRNILAKLQEPVTLKFYYSRTSGARYASTAAYAKRVRDLLGEYVAGAHGKIILQEIDPEPFTPEEDEASAAGLTPLTTLASFQPRLTASSIAVL